SGTARGAGDMGQRSSTVLKAGTGPLDLFTMEEDSGFGLDVRPRNDHVMLWSAGGSANPAAVVPVVASRGLMTALRVKVGDTLPVAAFGAGEKAHVVAV